MQAIVTRYLGPTDTKGARVKAACEAGSLTVSWSYAIGTEENHDRAAHALAERLGWLDERTVIIGGTLPRTNWHRCYVFTGRS